jgi:Phospholipase_D-nuclease N-terminal/Short C-terminal domain
LDGDVFVAFIIALIWIPLIILWVLTFADLFRRTDLTGLAKGLWMLVVFFLPFLGTLIYLIVRPMTEDYAPETLVTGAPAGAPSPSAQLEELNRQLQSGAISEYDYTQAKARILESG